VESIIIAGEATGNLWLKKQIEDAALAVKNGSAISDALANINVFAELINWIRLGENTGKLASNLKTIGERLEARWRRLVKRRISAIEPALIVITGLFVLLVVISILLPIISMQNILKAI
jgi:general secretion pathway protein F